MVASSRIRVRYSLRALLVFVTLFMLWGGYHTNRSWKTRAAMTLLYKHGGSFDSGPKRLGSGWGSDVRFRYQQLVQFVWRESFITVANVVSPLEPKIEDAIIALPPLESLDLSPSRLSEKEEILFRSKRVIEAKTAMPPGALARILAQRELKSLGLCTWVLSDEDCEAIALHHSLEGLNLYGSKLSEKGFAQLLTLPRLRRFSFSFCQVTGERLMEIPGSNTLEWIDCQEAPVGSEFAKFVGRSPHVTLAQFGSIVNDNIDDDFILALGAHPSLRDLSIGRSKVTDRSIPLIIKMPALQGVQLPAHRVTPEAAERLRKSRPDMKIFY